MDIQTRTDALNFLVFMYGKLIKLRARLEAEGMNVNAIKKREVEAAAAIDRLRAHLMDQWNQNAETVLTELKKINGTTQRHSRDLMRAIDRSYKTRDLLRSFDEALGLVNTLV